MPAKREHTPAATRIMVALAWIATAATLIVPLAVTPDLLDRFRVIKEGVTRTQGLLGLFLILVAVAAGSTERLREMLRERAIVAIMAAGMVWATITTLTSAHQLWSLQSLVSFLTSVLVAVSVWYAAPRIPLTILDVLVPAALVNTVLAALQGSGTYQPFVVNPLQFQRHLTATALIGNPNIVGSYMALVTVILAAAAVRVHGWRRWLYAFGTLCAGAGVFVSRTRTALIALVVGLVVLAIVMSVKRAAVVAVVLAVMFGAGYMFNVRVIRRIVSIPSRIASSGLEAATSGRVTPALVALSMFREHPVTGIGLGAFRFEYMPYQVRVREQYGATVRGVGATNFGETHNDHLQMLAETGLPGYALFVAALVAIIVRTRRSLVEDDRQATIKLIVPSLAATFVVLALAQFPLHVAITRHLLMTMAGLAIGWSRR